MGGIIVQYHQISPNLLRTSAFQGTLALQKGGVLLCAPRQGFLRSSVSIRSEVNGYPLPATDKRHSKEELIAFFRDIQTDIAKESPKTSRRARKQSADPFEEVGRRNQSHVSNEHPAEPSKKVLALEDMKVAELRELARARGIKGYSKLKKNDLIGRLKGV